MRAKGSLWLISITGEPYGVYAAADGGDARDAMSRYAGFKDFSDECRFDRSLPDRLTVEPVPRFGRKEVMAFLDGKDPGGWIGFYGPLGHIRIGRARGLEIHVGSQRLSDKDVARFALWAIDRDFSLRYREATEAAECSEED